MVDAHDALGTDSRAITARADELCLPLSSDASTSRSHRLFSQSTPLRDQTQWPSSPVPDVGSSFRPQFSYTYERASGSARSVDAITVALSKQHLHNDTQNPLAEIPSATLASSLATPFPTEDFTVQASSEQHQPTLPSESQPHVAALRSPIPEPSAPSQQDAKDSIMASSSAGIQNGIRLGRNISPRHANVTIKNEATQNLLESMVCSEMQCNVQASSSLGPMHGRTQEFCSIESESSLNVDEIMTDGIGLERPAFDKFLNTRCMLQPQGINKSLLPGYRSSKETALRCRNLVRSKPRMRKRTKLREQGGSSVVSSAASPNVASTATMSEAG